MAQLLLCVRDFEDGWWVGCHCTHPEKNPRPLFSLLPASFIKRLSLPVRTLFLSHRLPLLPPPPSHIHGPHGASMRSCFSVVERGLSPTCVMPLVASPFLCLCSSMGGIRSRLFYFTLASYMGIRFGCLPPTPPISLVHVYATEVDPIPSQLLIHGRNLAEKARV